MRQRLEVMAPRSARALRWIACALMLGSASCAWGTRAKNYAPANGPTGALIAVRVQGERADWRGELYASDSVGITLGAGRIIRIAWPRIAALDVHRMGAQYDIRWGEVVTAEKRTRLAMLSRFPQGLEGDLLARVLAAAHQDVLEEIR